MVKLSDYVVQFMVDRGIHDIFLASGGGIMHLLDSIGRNPGMNYYCNYHEQACAVAAEGYARMTGRIAACAGTTGPGAVNLLSGILACWVDSVPLFVLSGQVRTDLIADYSKIRQVGPQEGNVVAMAKPVTKYAVSVHDAKTIRYELERAFYEATTGRPGPVWIELPLDVQGAQIDETQLRGFSPAEPRNDGAQQRLSAQVATVIENLRQAKRPIIVPGNGIHYSGSRELLREFVARTNTPVILPLTAKDLFEESYPLQLGVFGGTGQRRANFAIQNSDCLIALAAGLNVQKIGFNVAGFAPKAKKIVVDIDEGQLTHQVLKPDVAIQASVRSFLEEALKQIEGKGIQPKERWLNACNQWKSRYPVMVPEYFADQQHVNTYAFMDALSDHLAAGDALVTGNGTDVVSYYQAFRISKGQRTINTGWGSMGWDLPNAIGICIANKKGRTVCVTGDGSIQWNIQELLTVGHYNLPLKIFVFNNRGYSCIRATQNNFFEGRFVGSDPASGVSNPDFKLLAAAYGIRHARINTPSELATGLRQVLSTEGPVLCEVNVAVGQGISPKASAFRREDGTMESRPLEDMAPFLPREEVMENMHMFDEENAMEPAM
jgi:acetolactate synthase-1/2/3 large subunit